MALPGAATVAAPVGTIVKGADRWEIHAERCSLGPWPGSGLCRTGTDAGAVAIRAYLLLASRATPTGSTPITMLWIIPAESDAGAVVRGAFLMPLPHRTPPPEMKQVTATLLKEKAIGSAPRGRDRGSICWGATTPSWRRPAERCRIDDASGVPANVSRQPRVGRIQPISNIH